MDEELALIAQPKTPLNHTRDVHFLSWAFLFIFLAYGAVQNLESTINTEKNLGTISLGVLYTSFTVSTLFASFVVRMLGSKNALILGTTGYWLFIAANLFPTWYTMVPVSLYLGFSASIIWVGQGTYLTSTARSHAYDHNEHEGTIIGQFNGEFWGMFASHQLVGNLLSLALLNKGEDGSTSEKRSKERGGTPRFFSHILFCSGLQQAFVWAEYTKFIVEPVLGEAGVGGAMAVYGAFDAICSLAAGRLTSGLNSITLIVCGGALTQAIVLLWLLLGYSTSTGLYGIVIPLIIAAIWGIGDGIFNTQLSALIALLFKHDMEGSFAQLKLWQSASTAIVFFVSPYITFEAMLEFMLVAVCISVAGFLVLTLKLERAFSTVTSDN
ncbi:putative Ion channel regulatory protein, UNC-93 [Heracleum sosnowskyi]|uniref:Ion channel regulatory protein, UNC-93 n=1 Tax=Heracleum sosnowskyi TaxID=360622 RepID=A0AAD8MWN9_9APIA|nr:putative Ion channel regulatory protein, UNC-93 [Heracleum sosnowskyi]